MSTDSKIRAIVVDDERPARSFLAALLRGFEDVELIGEAETGTEAVELIEAKRPDLAFLGSCQAARRYSLIRPLTVRRSRIGRSMGITMSESYTPVTSPTFRVSDPCGAA